MKVTRAASSAGGFPAIVSSLAHVLRQMNPWKGTRSLLRMNQTDGFDCPGCAWPDPDDRRSMAEFCENGAKAVAEEATSRRTDSRFFAAHSIEELRAWSDYELGRSGRLTEPMIRHEGSSHYEPIAWDAAFALVAGELRELGSPDEAIFYTSGRTSNEAAFLYQLFVRLFGTNNLPDCSNMCHESSGVALSEVIGIGKGTVTLEDFDRADCIVVIGQNPGTNHPRMLTALQSAARNGAQIISINPLKEAGVTRFKHPQEVAGWFGKGTPLASIFVPVRIGGDVALLKGIMKELVAAGSFDRDFIARHTEGFEEFRKDLLAASWDRIVEESGISRDRIGEVAQAIGAAKRLIVCWAMGMTQHRNAVGNIQEIANLLLLGGHFGRPGAGACPVRGHSNVQGDRTMGIYEKPSPQFLDALKKEFGFEPPRKHGLDTVDSIRAMLDGRAKVFFALGGNFLSATPDTEAVGRALANCRLTVQVSTKLNRGHLVSAKTALILPCLGRTEKDLQASGPQFVTVENSMGIVHSSRGQLKPASPELKSEVAIVAGLAEATLGVSWKEYVDDYGRIRDRISRVIPGFENFNVRIRNPAGFYLPNLVRDRCEFKTSTGKAKFTVHPIPSTKLAPGRFVLMTIRSHDQFNTTIYGLNDRYRGIFRGRRVVMINSQDLEDAGLAAGSEVDITSHFEGEKRVAKGFRLVPYSIPRRCLAAYFPETNVLVPLGSVAEKSNTPAYKSIEVSLSPCG
ncbi:MAG TPA: FdhF/YdeP family oxidoreductase [Bdellovibrionota bacterium]|nr:FdhF/YdeP family oxidoreductase [Bdellovibrionota bacterium]